MDEGMAGRSAPMLDASSRSGLKETVKVWALWGRRMMSAGVSRSGLRVVIVGLRLRLSCPARASVPRSNIACLYSSTGSGIVDSETEDSRKKGESMRVVKRPKNPSFVRRVLVCSPRVCDER